MKEIIVKINVPKNYGHENDIKDWLNQMAIAFHLEGLDATIEIDGQPYVKKVVVVIQDRRESNVN